MSSAVTLRPSARSSGRCSVRSWDTSRIASTGLARLRSPGSTSSSIIDRTIAVVPTLRYVAISERFASPVITWRRRYFCESQCGSSRVLTIGRFNVVSSPTSSSKKSARCVSWNGTSADVQPGRLDAHLPGAGEHLPGHEVRDHLGHDPRERHGAVHQVVLVAPVRVALAVRVVLVDDDLATRGQRACGGLHRPDQDELSRLVVPHDLHARRRTRASRSRDGRGRRSTEPRS